MTEKDCKRCWNGGDNGRYFFCKLCGHKFKPGDGCRFVYGQGKMTNKLVCDSCDGPFDEILKKHNKDMDTLKRYKYE